MVEWKTLFQKETLKLTGVNIQTKVSNCSWQEDISNGELV